MRRLVVRVLGALAFATPLTLASARPPSPAAPISHAAESKSPATPNAPEAVASYELVARLDTEEHVVHATGKIRWKNTSRVVAEEIYLHLYLNAFKDEKSLFLRSPFGAGRSGDKATEHGQVDVKSLVIQGSKENLWSKAEWQLSDDTTDARVPLPAPVGPGETLVLEISFESKLPKIVERTGYVQSYHFVAQWFPKLAKRELDGTWAHFPYHPQSEYYADFGDYRVTLEVPRGFVVGATGKLEESTLRGDLQRLTYAQRGIHDFAFTAWDQFVSTQTRIAGVEVQLLSPPGYERATELTRQTLARALPHFNERYGRYPYSTLTVVHPPDQAENSGGMEYPTLITTGGPWFAPFLGVRAIEAVTVHELGHQWFYGLLATNEHAWPFLDEGVNSYAEGLALEEFYGSGSLVDNYLLEVSMDSVVRALATRFGEDEVVGQAASEFTSFGSLGAHVYNRTATILDTVGRVYGRDELRAALGSYARSYRFGHPTPTDLFAALRAHLGEAAARNVNRAIFERGRVDYRIRSIQSVQEGDTALPARTDQGTGGSAAGGQWLSRVVVVRQGSLEFPVTVRLVFDDGTSVDKRWSGHGEAQALTHRGAAKLVSASVDPERRVRLDDNLMNNTRRASRRSLPRVWDRALYYAGLLLAFFGP